VKQYNRIRIAYIVGCLITGRNIATLYDVNNKSTIAIDCLPDVVDIRDFELKHRDHAGLNKSLYQCRYDCGKRHFIEIALKGNTFIGHITGSKAIFMGNVQGESIYIFDREDLLHIQYKISGCLVDFASGGDICTLCWMMK
jgi:hypothetical protein